MSADRKEWFSGQTSSARPLGRENARTIDSSTWPACTLSYRVFHLYWTLPLCIALYLLNRPFLTKLDHAKLILLPIIAFVWTTPWDNLIVKNHAWFYWRHCIWFSIGYVPIEEYFFFIIQSVMTTLWCSFVTRWSLPNLYLGLSAREQAGKNVPSDRPRRSLSRVSVAVALVCFAGGLYAAQPATPPYYFGMITWWCAIPLGLLFWGSADFVARMGLWAGWLPFAISILPPTVYLWCSDIYALRRGTWHINEATSLNIFPLPDLPIEEMLFFLVTNTILAIACFTFDRCVAICRSKPSLVGTDPASTALSPSFLPLNRLSTYQQLWVAFVHSDDSPPAPKSDSTEDSVAPRDLQLSLEVLRKASKSFNAASLLLPWDLRTDLGCLYAFCRVADDLVDDEVLGMERKTQSLLTIERVVDAVYGVSDRMKGSEARPKAESDPPVRERVSRVLDEAAIDEILKLRILAAACSIAPLARFIPHRLWLEMLDGYRTDLHFEHPDSTLRTRLQTMDELVEYSQCVAGVVGEMCTRVILARCGCAVPLNLLVDRTIALPAPTGKVVSGSKATKPLPEPTQESSATARANALPLDLTNPRDLQKLLYEARRMGVSLQLVNIARDIVPDSVELKRCYLPRELFDDDDADLYEALVEHRMVLPGQGSALSSSSEESGSASDKAPSIRPKEVRKYALRLLDVSRQLYAQAFPALGQIPNRPARAGLRAACSVYAAIGTRIESQSEHDINAGCRARMSHLDRFRRALSAVYLGGSSV
ncbi:Phytoene synthase [Testicularia cyperi]|uniref:Bifunctional lycopene cyclase/phytoene synthase n=1 Tax=Testicularia cyperi TaxID=1882483 RepID=A0A317XNI2_9BASI|nr:Phytoene synthase [Testicularia cyperi]